MRCESLEQRRLMSVSFDVPGKIITVNGTNADDTITAKIEAGNLQISDNGALFSVTASAVKKIFVFGKDGHDNITLDPSVNMASHLDSGPNTIIDSGDTIQGGSGPDIIHLRSANGSARGGSGNDVIYNYIGLTQLFGQGGNDQLHNVSTTPTSSLYDGGGGYDLVNMSNVNAGIVLRNGVSGIYFPDTGIPPIVDGSNADSVANMESFYGGKGNDYIFGNDVSNYIRGYGGNDYIRGGGGNDELDGGAGNDQVFGDAGNDILRLRDGLSDTGNGGNGFDSAQSNASDILNSIEASIP